MLCSQVKLTADLKNEHSTAASHTQSIISRLQGELQDSRTEALELQLTLDSVNGFIDMQLSPMPSRSNTYEVWDNMDVYIHTLLAVDMH